MIVFCIFLFFREAISAVCERRGVDVDSINVYLEQSRTPLPLLTTETAWLGGRHIRIRGMYLQNMIKGLRGSTYKIIEARGILLGFFLGGGNKMLV